MRRLLPTVLAALISAAPAAAFVADNGLLVRPGPQGTILVGAKGATSGRDFFCAAGDYAFRVLGARPVSDLVLMARPARSDVFNGARTAQFTIGSGAGRGTGFAVGTRAGESMTVAHARHLCAMDDLLGRSF